MDSKLEFGTSSSFGLLNRKKANALVDYAIEKGITKFDTAVNYGNWKSQPLLGLCLEKHLKKNREIFSVSSKAGTHNRGWLKIYKNFSPEYIENMILRSINELNCDYLDKFYLHGPKLNQIETKGLLKNLKKLKKNGKIKSIGINTHEFNIMDKISRGFYEEIDSILIDYNLLQQDRSYIFSNCDRNNIKISAGTALCQGLLINSPFYSFLKKGNLFYMTRLIFKRTSRKYVSSAKLAREYMQKMFSEESRSIPLSFILNNKYINSVPIGMLSKESIRRNIFIENHIVDIGITNSIAEWCLNHSQVDFK